MFAIQPTDAAVVQQAAASAWRPMRAHRNLQLLRASARQFMDMMSAVASVRIQAEIEKVAPKDSAKAARDAAFHTDLRGFLHGCRQAEVAIQLAERIVVPDVARYFQASAPECISLVKAAIENLHDIRALIATVIDERDDEDLGYAFVPAPPVELGNGGSVELADLSLPPCKEPVTLRFSEAAAFQISEMHARAQAAPDGVRALFWKGVEFALGQLHDAAETFTAPAPDREYRPITFSSIGKARIFFVASVEKGTVVVLYCAASSPSDDWKVVNHIRERLASQEWDRVFEELDSYMRPTARGREVMVKVLESTPGLSAEKEHLLARLRTAAPFDPVYIEDVRNETNALVAAAEDLIDNEDADAAKVEAGRVPWDEVKSEFDA